MCALYSCLIFYSVAANQQQQPRLPSDSMIKKLDFTKAQKYVVAATPRSLTASREQNERRSPVRLLQVPQDASSKIPLDQIDGVIGVLPDGGKLSPRGSPRTPSSKHSIMSFSLASASDEKKQHEEQKFAIFSNEQTDALNEQVFKKFEPLAKQIFDENVAESQKKSKRIRPLLSPQRTHTALYLTIHATLSECYKETFGDVFRQNKHPRGFDEEFIGLKANAICRAWLDKAIDKYVQAYLAKNKCTIL